MPPATPPSPTSPLTMLLAQGRSLYQAGKPREALALLQAEPALRQPQPEHAELLNLAGACALALGDASAAEAILRQAMVLRRDYVDAPNNLGVLLQGQGRWAEAEAAFRHTTTLNPRFAAGWFSLANVLPVLGRAAEAETACRQAIALMPAHAGAHHLLGVLLRHAGRLDQSEAACRQSLALQAGNAEAWHDLAQTLQAASRPAEAATAWQQALALAPGFTEALHHLANLLNDQRRFADAEALYRQVLTQQPDNGSACASLANILVNRGQLEEAEPICQRATRLRPDDGFALSLWVMIRRNLCQWEGLDAAEARLADLLAAGAGGGIQPNRLIALKGFSALQQKEASRQLAEVILASLKHAEPLCRRHPEPRARLRIGYLSADFHAHATVYLLAGVLEAHDPVRVERYVYSYGPAIELPERQRIVAAADVFRDIQLLNDEDAAALIAVDNVDILVDLKGYTNRVRLRITAQRPAPVIINWLGYPGTLGHVRLADYFIGDAIASPLEHAAHFSETLALLPRCYQPNDSRRPLGPRPSRAELGLPENGFVFCNFNQAYKTTPERWAQWCSLLRAVPGSVLWLLQPNESRTQENLLAAARDHGIDADRLIFAPSCEQTIHLGRLPLADLALDTFPCASHTTASDALWAGLPLLTQAGETFASRVAASILQAMDLPELVTQNDEEYMARALELATQPERLQALRERIATGRSTSPLFDTTGFAWDLEELYARIWEQECVGQRAAVTL